VSLAHAFLLVLATLGASTVAVLVMARLFAGVFGHRWR
jgi:hypothetical protein